MTYKEKVSFNGKFWYQLEWKDVDFKIFESVEGFKDSENIEELEKIILNNFPNSDFKYTYIGKRK